METTFFLVMWIKYHYTTIISHKLFSPPYLEVGSYLFRITIRFGICALSTSICPSRDCFLIDFVCIGVPEKLESDKATQFKSH